MGKSERLQRKTQKAYEKYKAVDKNNPEKSFKYYLKWLHLERNFRAFHKQEKQRKKEFLRWFKKDFYVYGACISEVLLRLVDYEYDYWSHDDGHAAADEYIKKVLDQLKVAKKMATDVRRKEAALYETPFTHFGEEEARYNEYHKAVVEFFTYVGEHCDDWSD